MTQPIAGCAEGVASRFAAASALGLRFRRMREADLPFLGQLYASTRWEELAPVPWPEADKSALLAMQFRAQHAHHQANYPGADWLVIERVGAAVGRLYLARWAREHRIIDIALMPAHRGQGLGTALMHDLMVEAADARKALTIHVEKNNPAMSLYRRLGFVTTEDKGVYDLMRWTAPWSIGGA